MSLGESIKHLRESNKLTMKEFADKLGVERVSVIRWEKGDTEPKFEILLKICPVLSCDLNELTE